MPILTDDLRAIIGSAAAPLPRSCRDAFEKAVAAELSRYPEVGVGVVHRVCRELQRSHFEPPQLDRAAGCSKYR